MVRPRCAIPDETSDNFLGFSVTMNGVEITPQLQQRAWAAGIDVTDDLVTHGVPLMPFAETALEALANVPDDVLEDWIRRGIVIPNEYDDNADQKIPFWTMRSAYYWDAKFPAGETVSVSHVYRPSVGGTAGTSFYSDGKFNERFAEYEYRYCTVNAHREGRESDGYPRDGDMLPHVLTTGGNGAAPSGFRHLTRFATQPRHRAGAKTDPPHEEDYYPERDINILSCRPMMTTEQRPCKQEAGHFIYVAIAQNGVIGRDGASLALSTDLKRFKASTMEACQDGTQHPDHATISR